MADQAGAPRMTRSRTASLAARVGPGSGAAAAPGGAAAPGSPAAQDGAAAPGGTAAQGSPAAPGPLTQDQVEAIIANFFCDALAARDGVAGGGGAEGPLP